MNFPSKPRLTRDDARVRDRLSSCRRKLPRPEVTSSRHPLEFNPREQSAISTYLVIVARRDSDRDPVDHYVMHDAAWKANCFLEQVNLIDEFDILQIVGEGWFGKILLTEHRSTQTEMVLKALPKAYTGISDFFREFHYGLHLAAHRNIITTYDVAFETAGFYVFSQEYAPLGERIFTRPRTCRPLLVDFSSSSPLFSITRFT